MASAQPKIIDKAAIDTMIGLARNRPTISPWAALIRAPNARALKSPNATPPKFIVTTKTMAEAPTVAPRLNDMILPLIVINVMPTATQPMNDTVVSSETMLGQDMNPGVVNAIAARAIVTLQRSVARSIGRSDAITWMSAAQGA